MRNINFMPSKNPRTLFVVLSGISGGKDEPLVQYLSEAVKSRGSVLSMQFANDPLYHDDALPETGEMTFYDCFDRIDHGLQIAGGVGAYTDIVFVTHSFSSVIAAYYLGLHMRAGSPTPRYTLVSIDSDPSSKIIEYLDTLSEEDFKNESKNPFHSSVVEYMRGHDSAKLLETLPFSVGSIDASEIGADHEFTSDESKRMLAERILLSP